MGGMEFNKIFAALLIAGIIAMFAGFVAKQSTSPHHLEEDAYHVEAAEGPVAGGAAAEKLPEPILAMLGAADIARGQKVTKACAACHNFEQNGANGVGPHLWGVVGRKKQSLGDFSYSGTLNSQGGDVWTYEELNKFLWKPKKYASGTKMSFVGIAKPEDRAAVLAYLRTLAGSSAALPSAADIAKEEADLAPAVVEAPAAEAVTAEAPKEEASH